MKEMTQEVVFDATQQTEDNSLVNVEQSRAVAEVQAKYVMARKFPRDQNAAYSAIISACKRPTLAEQSMYAYRRGAGMVTGPSIRLAEAIAQNWGNLDCGIREISQSNGVSVAEAYAIDLCTNTHVSKIFHVPHVRDTKQGRKRLTDARDIYEIVANQGARRLRACILAVVPGDVVEAAVKRCQKTLESSEVPLAEQVRNMVVAFDELGIKLEHLEKRLGHPLESTIVQEITSLKSIYRSIKDGIVDRSEFFDISSERKKDGPALIASLTNKINPETGEVNESKTSE